MPFILVCNLVPIIGPIHSISICTLNTSEPLDDTLSILLLHASLSSGNKVHSYRMSVQIIMGYTSLAIIKVHSYCTCMPVHMHNNGLYTSLGPTMLISTGTIA